MVDEKARILQLRDELHQHTAIMWRTTLSFPTRSSTS